MIDEKVYEQLRNNKITELNLKYKGIKNLDELCECLKTNSSLVKLDLSFNNIDINKLCEIIKTNSSITCLNLYGCSLENIDKLCEDGLKYNKTIKELHLGWNNIENINKLGDILKTNASIEKLYLEYNCIKNMDYLYECLKSNKTLKHLDLSYNYLTKNHIEYVNKLCELLKVNKTLTELNIGNNHLGIIDKIIDKIKLVLINNDSEILKSALIENESLKYQLDLDDKTYEEIFKIIDDINNGLIKNIEQIKECLKYNKTLSKINLYGNDFNENDLNKLKQNNKHIKITSVF